MGFAAVVSLVDCSHDASIIGYSQISFFGLLEFSFLI